ncbi:hypothetical protein FISHEDRAFT_77915 [Fistulina hepatica ATCC 64428]|nr:hypothetical protein FISHEDRAFT_77915 [Fistulina hepatica ATCC 64428]
MALHSRPEPMNASPYHPKVRVLLTLGSPLYIAGGFVTGKMELECRADQGLGLNVIMVELFGTQELMSRDNTSKSTFLHSRRFFQGPDLPPSNAVDGYPSSDEPPLPPQYYQARRGLSSFFFRFPLPSSAPSSTDFDSVAKVRYEVRATAGVFWNNEKRLVTCTADADVVERYEGDIEAEDTTIAENGKIWVHARLLGGVLVAGESSCVELQVKNHSVKWNTGLHLSVLQTLVTTDQYFAEKSPFDASEALSTASFVGPEYIVYPGVEGVARLVFDIPRHARSVRGGFYEGDELPQTQSIFQVDTLVRITMTMRDTSDIHLHIPVRVVHPNALPELNPPVGMAYPSISPPETSHMPVLPPEASYAPAAQCGAPFPVADCPNPYTYSNPSYQPVPPPAPVSPSCPATVVPSPFSPQYSYAAPFDNRMNPPLPPNPTHALAPSQLSLARSSSVGALHEESGSLYVGESVPSPWLPLVAHTEAPPSYDNGVKDGKGLRASRIAQHLRRSSRNRSTSPSYRYPMHANLSMSYHPLPVPPALDRPPAVLLSPRPILTHRRSSESPAGVRRPKSECVEDLERMADQNELSVPMTDDVAIQATVRHGGMNGDINKTLPGPPVPTMTDKKRFVLSAPPKPSLTLNGFPSSSSMDNTSFSDPLSPITSPPTPTLMAIRAPATRRTPLSPHPKLGEFLSADGIGLDALERQLLSQVGTRKPVDSQQRPDARDVLCAPIVIPKKGRDDEDPANESAISSLTLAGAGMEECAESRPKAEPLVPQYFDVPLEIDDWDARTHKGKRKSKSSSKTVSDGEGVVKTDSGNVSRTRKQKKRSKEKIAHKDPHRKGAHVNGRVTAWLGGVVDAEPPDAPSTSDDHANVIEGAKATTMFSDAAADSTARSSGFVPIGNLEDNDVAFRRVSYIQNHESRKLLTGIWGTVTTSVRKGKLPAFSPSQSSELEEKHPQRSARGGRGGQVAAIAALWSSGGPSKEQGNNAKPHKASVHVKSRAPPMGKVNRDASRTPVRVKGPSAPKTSVPAVVSSSHAVPMLSTTRSLARIPSRTGRSASATPTQEARKSNNPISPPARSAASGRTSGELAFGPARLRDLIKKYQGLSAS